MQNMDQLADVYSRLSKQGVISYVIAYDMENKPMESVLPLIVAKSWFLILPEDYQSDTVASHLASVSTQATHSSGNMEVDVPLLGRRSEDASASCDSSVTYVPAHHPTQ